MPSQPKQPAWLKQKGYLSNVPTDQLVERLATASEYLSTIDQDASTAAFDVLAEALVSPKILRHKDKEARLLAACCLADVMRIYAPDAPYDDDTVKEICSLFVAQLQGLRDTVNQSYAQYFYLLERLAMVRTFIVLLEMDADEVIVNVFEALFNVVSNDHSSKAKSHMVDIMNSLIEESEGLSQAMLDTILTPLIEPQKTEEPVAWELAKQLLVKSANSLTGVITSFMHDVINHEKSSESELSDRVYDIILEVNRIDPEILVNVTPQLTAELKIDDSGIRRKCVELLLKMFTERGSAMPNEYEELFRELIQRFNDHDTDIRLLMVESSGDLLRYHRKDFPVIEEEMRKRVTDLEDPVRAAAAEVLCKAAMSDPAAVSDDLMREVGDRILDKKLAVHQAARENLVKFYSEHAATHGGAEQYRWIPSRLLSFYSEQDSTSKGDERKVQQLGVLKTFATELLPPGRAQPKRLMAMYANFDKKDERTFFNMINEQIKFQKYFEELANSRNEVKQSQGSQEHEQTAKAKLRQRIHQVARYFPDAKRAGDLLTTLIGIKNARVFKLLLELRRVDIGRQQMETAQTELMKLLSREVRSASGKECLEKFLSMLKMEMVGRDQTMAVVNMLANHNNGAFQFQAGDSDDDDMEQDDDAEGPEYTAEHMLEFCVRIAQMLPDAFRSCFAAMHSMAINIDKADHIPKGKLFHLLRLTGHLFSAQPLSKLRPIIRKIATFATDENAAENCVRAVAALGSGETAEGGQAKESYEMTEETITELAEKFVDSLAEVAAAKKAASGKKAKGKKSKGGTSLTGDSSDQALVGKLAALGVIAETHPSVFERHVEDIQDFVVNEVLAVGRKSKGMAVDLYGNVVKVAGLNVLTAQLLGLQECPESHEASQPVWKLLTKIIEKQGDMANQVDDPETDEDCGSLRLAAARCCLKILKVASPNYEASLVKQDGLSLQTLSLLTEDHFESIRNQFGKALFDALADTQNNSLQGKLKYFVLFSMMRGLTTDAKLKQNCRKWFDWGITTRRQMIARSAMNPEKKIMWTPEAALPYLVSLLADSRSFDAEAARRPPFKGFADAFQHFFGGVISGSSSNLSFMMANLQMVKSSAVDARHPEDSENLYVVSEIALASLRSMSAGKYTDMEKAPIVLPRGLYAKQDGGDTHVGPRLPEGFVPPKAAKKESGSRSTPGASAGTPSGAPGTKTGSRKRSGEKSAGKGTGKVQKTRRASAVADNDDMSESESEESDEEMFGSGASRKGSAGPARKRLPRAAKALQPMLAESDDEDA